MKSEIDNALTSLESLADHILLNDFVTDKERNDIYKDKQAILDALELLRRDELVLSWFKEHVDEKETWASGGDGYYCICFSTHLTFEPSEPAPGTKEQCEAFRAWLGL